MKRVIKFSISIILLIVFKTNSYCQVGDTLVYHSTNAQKISIFRKTIWDSLPKPTSWITDFENLFTDEEQFQLDSTISKFEKETTIEIAIITIDTIFVAKADFENFTLHIANQWGVGKKEKDNGILIGISKGYRIIRIENGYGNEKFLSDDETKQIIENYFIPDFKNADYFKGTMNGLKEIMNRLKAKSNRA